MITSARVIKKSVTATDSSPSQEHYSDLDDHTTGSNVAPGFKPTTQIKWQIGSALLQGVCVKAIIIGRVDA